MYDHLDQESLETRLTQEFKKRDLPLDGVRIFYAVSKNGERTHISVRAPVEAKKLPKARKAVYAAIAQHSSDEKLDWSVAGTAEEWSKRLEDLKDVAEPKREVNFNDWTLGRVRNWITLNAPQGVEVLATDIIELNEKRSSKRKRKSFVLVRVGVLPEYRENGVVSEKAKQLKADLRELARSFERETELPLLVEPLPIARSSREMLQQELDRTVVTREDLPRLQELLQQKRGWQAPVNKEYLPMLEGDWVRIDDKNVLKPEDLLWLEPSDGKLIAHVALPDITGKSPNGNGSSPGKLEESESAPRFFSSKKRGLAWIVDFSVEETGLRVLKPPYRGLVRCKREYTPNSHQLHLEPGFEELCSALAAKSGEAVITRLMEHTYEAIGSFLAEHGDPFLTRKKSERGSSLISPEACTVVCRELAQAGVAAGPEDFTSQFTIAALMKRALEEGAVRSLAALASALRGDPIVCINESGRCQLKPERGSLEQVNQWILAARVDHKIDARPPFMQEVADQVALSPQVISNHLKDWETQRSIHILLKMLIRDLADGSVEHEVRVRFVNDDEVLCDSPDLKRPGFIRGTNGHAPGASLRVKPVAFHLDKGRWEFVSRNGTKSEGDPEKDWTRELRLPAIPAD